jgi:hypothetical protein
MNNKATSKPEVKRLCEVCGARVTNINPAVTTCDTICTRARNVGWSRERQLRYESRHKEPMEKADYCPGCGMIRSQCDCWDSVNGDR